MEVFNCPSMKSIPAICIAGIALVVSAVAGEAPQAFEITLDPEADFVRDLRESTAAPVLGYAGSMIEYPDSMLQWLFVTNRAETAQMMKAAGARLVKVAGFELGNEPYWGKDPEEYGRRWCAIVPAMKEVWPDAQIGMPLAEYRPNDPDIASVCARCEDMT
jgi:hypothetical protein